MDLNLSSSLAPAQLSTAAVNQPVTSANSQSFNDSSNLLAMTNLLVQIIQQLVDQLHGSSSTGNASAGNVESNSAEQGVSTSGSLGAQAPATSSLSLPAMSVAPIPSLTSNESSFPANSSQSAVPVSSPSTSSILSVSPYNVSPIPSLLGEGAAAPQTSDSASLLAVSPFDVTSIPSLLGNGEAAPQTSDSASLLAVSPFDVTSIPSLLGDAAFNPNNSNWK